MVKFVIKSVTKKEEMKLRLLSELMKGSRRSDRELSKIIGCTRATISRKRVELEKEGLIKEYTIIPDIAKLGYKICALIFLTWAQYPSEDDIKIGKKWLAEQANILFCAAGEGLATNLIVSVHRDFAEFCSFIGFLRVSSQPKLSNLQFFVIDLTRKEVIFKDFSFRDLIHCSWRLETKPKNKVTNIPL